jgi:small subunit ribosomal protein S16
MEVSIRLQRSDAKATGRYNFRIVAIPKQAPRQGRALELLGYYDAGRNPSAQNLKVDKIEKWVANGAQMSQTVRDLLKKAKKNK